MKRLLNSGFAVGILLLLTACNRRPSDGATEDGRNDNAPRNLPGIEYNSYAYGKRYQVTIPYAKLDKAPKWCEADENPPLSAKKALKAANSAKDSLTKDDKERKWILESLALTPAREDRWFWTATYEPKLEGFGTIRPVSFKVVVLMNGEVIKPKVSDDE